MKYTYTPKSATELTNVLIGKGIIVEELKDAIQNISCIGYFRFKRFSSPFHTPDGTGDYNFAPNTYFEDIIDIYKFDSQLRSIIFEAVAGIEIAAKSLINFAMTTRYGTHWYLETDVYTDKFINDLDSNYQSGYDKLIERVTSECNQSRETFVRRYKSTYTDPFLPPSWMVMEIMPFGTCCTIYQHIKSADARREVAAQFGINHLDLDSWLVSMNNTRNKCAHHQKIYNGIIQYPPTLPKRSANQF